MYFFTLCSYLSRINIKLKNFIHQFSHLWRKERQSDVSEEHPEVLLSMLDIVPHPHHQSLENGLFVRNIDVIAGEQLNNLCRGEQKKLLILYDLQEVFLVQKGDTEETDNHQLLAEEMHSGPLCVCVHVHLCMCVSVCLSPCGRSRTRTRR